MKYEAKNKAITLFMYLLFVLNHVNCDLPVHCLAKDIKGEWIFFHSLDLKDTQQSCGH